MILGLGFLVGYLCRVRPPPHLLVGYIDRVSPSPLGWFSLLGEPLIC